MKIERKDGTRVMTEACYMGRHGNCGGSTTCSRATYVETPCECRCHAAKDPTR